MKMLDTGFLKAKPNRTDLKIQKLKTQKLTFYGSVDKNRLRQFGEGF